MFPVCYSCHLFGPLGGIDLSLIVSIVTLFGVVIFFFSKEFTKIRGLKDEIRS